VLEFVHAAPAPVSVKAIAAGVGLKLGTTYHLVNTLLADGYLVRNPDRSIGPGRVPGTIAPSPAPQDASMAVRRALGRAAYAVDDVAVLTRLDGPETRVTATAEVPGAQNAGHYPVDAHALSHLLAAGRVIIAHQEPETTEAVIERTRRAAQAAGELLDEGELRDDLAAATERHWCALVGDGDACVSAPVLDERGHAVAAVAIVVRPRRLHAERARLAAIAIAAARDVGRRLDLP
jgi:DNA-binding IclR family transcriptional regulator